MATILYSILHMLVDGVCAVAMFGWFSEGMFGYLNILLYNFCAFALQMPMGLLLDLKAYNGGTRRNYAYIYAAAGAFFTIIGSFTHPIVLGIGNALFHVGGGVDVIREDRANHWRGQALGVFVAPGAFGLYVGSLIAKQGNWQMTMMSLISAGIVMAGVLVVMHGKLTVGLSGSEHVPNVISWESGIMETGTNEKGIMENSIMENDIGHSDIRNLDFKNDSVTGVMVACILVVVLRSYIGMAINFSWKTTVAMGMMSVLAVVLGKIAGGLLAARFEVRKVVAGSLALAAVCYWFSGMAVFGIAALFFFNMTMPITLCFLAEGLGRLTGFAFGLLTFALFLGFLPVYFEISLPVPGHFVGMVGSVVSLILLMLAAGKSSRTE